MYKPTNKDNSDKNPVEVALDKCTHMPRATCKIELQDLFSDYEYTKCLDETDGQFKDFAHLSSHRLKRRAEGDFKNNCHICDIQFYNLTAALNHYLFNHPDPCLLPKKPPVLPKQPPLQDAINKSVVENSVTEEASCLPENFTLENIKAFPRRNIKVVKKSDINFQELKLRPDFNKFCCKRLELECQTNALREPQQQNQMFDSKVSYPHLFQRHRNGKLACHFCGRLCPTTIGTTKHIMKADEADRNIF